MIEGWAVYKKSAGRFPPSVRSANLLASRREAIACPPIFVCLGPAHCVTCDVPYSLAQAIRKPQESKDLSDGLSSEPLASRLCGSRLSASRRPASSKLAKPIRNHESVLRLRKQILGRLLEFSPDALVPPIPLHPNGLLAISAGLSLSHVQQADPQSPSGWLVHHMRQVWLF